MPAIEARNVPHALSLAGQRFPDCGILFHDRRGRPAERLAYRDLHPRARAVAGRFRRAEIEPGDRVLVCLPSGPEWIETWFGVVLAGGLPVAIAPPEGLGSPSALLAKIDAVATQLDARWLVSREALAQTVRSEGLSLAERVLAVESLNALEPLMTSTDRDPEPDETAFLQLTSGSTGLPRAVMVSHAAVAHHAVASGEIVGRTMGGDVADSAGSIVSWLPLHHDMGLIGGVFLSLVSGVDLHLLSPRSFLARPRTWLEAVGRGRRVVSPAPNFAFSLCNERVLPEDLGKLDLSTWGAAPIGAEMVRPEVVAAFGERFAAVGLDERVLRPCYGLAEATLTVTMDSRNEGLRTRPVPVAMRAEAGFDEVACTGAPVIDTEVRVAKEDGSEVAQGGVGEVQVRGPGVFQGYFEDPSATRDAFSGNWLRTGDLGFLHAGELYLVGRRKEILILRGQNVMPHEIEWVVEEIGGLGGSQRAAAFSVPGDEAGEQAVVVVESRGDDARDLERLEHEIRTTIGRRLGIVPADVVFVRRGRIPKTTSGKVQRRELRVRYLSREIERIV